MKWQEKNIKKNWGFGSTDRRALVLFKKAKNCSCSKVDVKKTLFLVSWRYLLKKKV